MKPSIPGLSGVLLLAVTLSTPTGLEAAQRAAPRGGGGSENPRAAVLRRADTLPAKVRARRARRSRAKGPRHGRRPRQRVPNRTPPGDRPASNDRDDSRNDSDRIARAVPRRNRPIDRGNATIFVPRGYYGGYYPWGYSGLGFGYYGYGPFDDAWLYGGYQGGYGYTSGFEGKLRLKVKPREADVFVDGYYAGRVDDFDGVFQRLHVESGAHRIESGPTGDQDLAFDVRILPDDTTTYTGTMNRLP